MQPSEWATTWKDFTLWVSKTDFSIISTCSLRVYSESVGLGLLPNPSRSTAKNLRLDFADSDKFGYTVSDQNREDDMNPWMKRTSSSESPGIAESC